MNNLYYMGLYGGGNDYYHSSCSPDYVLERKNATFYNENEGFVKGNIQKNTYNPYRNYNPSLPTVSNDRERLLLEIQKYGFYLLDLGLYLDLNPSDKQALELFNENRAKYFRLVNQYNNNYNPLMSVDSNSKDKYEWLEGTFPLPTGRGN